MTPKTAAIADARTYVALPKSTKDGGWVLYAPRSYRDLHGPSYEYVYRTYHQALRARRLKVAYIALVLMGVLDVRRAEAAAWQYHNADRYADVRSIVDAGLAALNGVQS